jgi:hypothetical protein
MLGLGDVSYGLEEFRRDLHAALRTSFGANEVAPGKIALTVDESSARLAADVTPYLMHRRYTGRRLPGGEWESHEGIETRSADAPGRRIIQWPDQHYDRGVAKNDATGRRYKRVVRILKCLRDDIAESGASDARVVARAIRSCFLEHAAYNAPDTCFALTEGSYYGDVRAVISHLWNAARDHRAAALAEVGGMQALFRPEESWSPKSLEDFMLVAWQHVGFPSV